MNHSKTWVMLATLSLSGCATIFSGGGSQSVSIKSVPEGAKVVVVNQAGSIVQEVTTPATFKLRRGAGFFKPAKYSVTLSRPGFQSKTIAITPTMTGWYFANILIGGALGMLIVDPATGAMYSLQPRKIDATLDSASARNGETALTVMLLADVPVESLQDLQLLDAR